MTAEDEFESGALATEQHGHAASKAQSSAFRRDLLAWYAGARRDLPWRRTKNPYAIWLSEIMLQQTRVDTVVPYYERFMEAFPTVGSLAEAELDDVLALWSGLGYYRRARMMHTAAKHVSSEMAGQFPSSPEALRRVQGIGPYTAGAVASIAFDYPAPLVDGNVARVLARVYAVEADVRAKAGLSAIWKIAADLVPEAGAGDWNQALMELGAMICVPRSPGCQTCPVRASCAARAQGREHELPRLKTKTKPHPWTGASFVLTQGDRVLLGRRRTDRMFGGLWEPPTAASEEGIDARGSLERVTALRVSSLERVGEITHVLSHRKMSILVFRGKIRGVPRKRVAVDYDAFELVDPRRFRDRGMSTLAKKILHASQLR